MKKIGAFLISLIIATIVFNIVFALIALTIGLPFISTHANAVNILIAVIGLIIASYSGILTFKRMFRYFKKEFQNI